MSGNCCSKDVLEGRAEGYGDILRASDCVITISEFCKNSFVEKYGADANKIEVVNNAPQEALLRYANHNQGAPSSRPQRSVNIRDFILYPANFYPHKNHSRLLSAYKIANERGIDLPDLVLVGMGWGGADCLSVRITDLGIADKVRVRSGLTPHELADLYKACAFVILPTLFEGFCLPAVEALSFGQQLVCADLQVLREVSGGEALFFDPYDSEAMLEAI